ncbi:hypothetical protein [Streptomyces longwoodensis]|uniref:hypothetical protein n=1 Tax=Streptomyces longwoodensis TaxID=68231 RepID=UPI002255366A|nr:hypothetical protein [Streptomyces longwoodensis]MCX4994301.1 hypothetical protein [Streptomyces longwoodensis]
MSAPLVVNTADGTVWTRRGELRGGESLYAPEGVCSCPPFVMATLAELAEHGIAGSADCLPVPVGPARPAAEVERLRELLREATAGTAVADELTAVWRQRAEGAEARVEQLLAERHQTNENLSEAAEALRRQRDRITELETAQAFVYRAEHPDSGIVLGTYSKREAAAAHCEALARREGATGLVSWVPDDSDALSPEELTFFDVEYCDGDDVPAQTCTGYVITPLEVASEYDEGADE